MKNKHLTEPLLLNGSMCTLNSGPVLGHRLLSCIKSVAWRKTREKVHILWLEGKQEKKYIFCLCAHNFSAAGEWICILDCISPIWTPRCVSVCASAGGTVGMFWSGWNIGLCVRGCLCPAVGEREKESESERGSDEGWKQGRWDTLMMLILGLSHRWYEWFLFGRSSSRTPGVLLSFLLLFIYLPILSPDPPPPPHIFLNTTTTLLFWLPC